MTDLLPRTGSRCNASIIQCKIVCYIFSVFSCPNSLRTVPLSVRTKLCLVSFESRTAVRVPNSLARERLRGVNVLFLASIPRVGGGSVPKSSSSPSICTLLSCGSKYYALQQKVPKPDPLTRSFLPGDTKLLEALGTHQVEVFTTLVSLSLDNRFGQCQFWLGYEMIHRVHRLADHSSMSASSSHVLIDHTRWTEGIPQSQVLFTQRRHVIRLDINLGWSCVETCMHSSSPVLSSNPPALCASSMSVSSIASRI